MVMRNVLFLFLAIGILTGCQELGNQAEELGSEVEEESGEVLEAETGKIVNNMNQELNQAVEDADQAVVSEGEGAVIKRDVLFPVNEDAYERLFAYLDQPDYTKIDEMRKAEDLLYVEENTKVEVLDADVLKAKVSIESTGQEGYIPTKFLEQA
jgi:hypothetical protein